MATIQKQFLQLSLIFVQLQCESCAGFLWKFVQLRKVAGCWAKIIAYSDCKLFYNKFIRPKVRAVPPPHSLFLCRWRRWRYVRSVTFAFIQMCDPFITQLNINLYRVNWWQPVSTVIEQASNNATDRRASACYWMLNRVDSVSVTFSFRFEL